MDEMKFKKAMEKLDSFMGKDSNFFVCADVENLIFSAIKGEGEIIAKNLYCTMHDKSYSAGKKVFEVIMNVVLNMAANNTDLWKVLYIELNKVLESPRIQLEDKDLENV